MLFLDRLSNVISGLATGKDKTSYNRHVHVPRGTDELLAAYRDNWLARKVVDIVPFDMLREWRAWKAKDEQVQALEAAETALDLRRKLNSGMVCGRLYGGGGILIGDGAANPREELIIDKLPKGGIKYLHVLSRHELGTGQIIRDPLSAYYGRPEYYQVASGDGVQIEVHPSRIVPFFGAPLPEDWRRRGEFWSDSILQAVLEPADQATSAAGHIAAMLPEALTEVVSIPGLTELVSTAEGEAMVTKRLSTAKLMRSLFNVTLIDGTAQNGGEGGDTWQQKQLSFDTLPDVGRFFLQIAAGAADVPATRLLSQSPDGMNATGAADIRNYYDHCAARQKVELTPTIRPLDRCLIRHALGDEPPEVWYDWNPLYQESQAEKATTFKTVADAVAGLNGTALVPAEILAKGVKGWLQDSGQLPGLDAAYDEHGDAPLTEGDTNADQYDANGNPGEGFTGVQSEDPINVVPFPARAAVGDAAPRTLYVSRKLTNAADVLSWAKKAGIPNLMPADSLHVTIAYSRQPVDWMKVGDTWQGAELKVEAGGPHLLERFGDALVLLFASDALQYRHREIGEAGASWDHPEYQPHVTLSWDAPDVDVDALAAYNGPLVFGPEIFEPVNEDWRAGLTGDAAVDLDEEDEATEEEIAAIGPERLRALFGPEMLAGVRFGDKQPGGLSGIVAAFNELLHPRGPGGKFAPKGSGSAKAAAKPMGKAKAKAAAGEEKLTKGGAALKTAGVSHDDEIAVLSKRVKAYAGSKTVRDFVDNHPKGKAYALRKLAADHEKGVIGFKAASASSARPAADKYNADNFSDFSDTDHRTTIEVERDLYKTMLTKPETPAEKTSIGVYSGAGYSSINGHLRGKNPATALMRQNIANIDNVLARSKIPEDTVVYRGIKPPFAKEILGAKAGSVISDPGYVSTSLKSDTSNNFATAEGVVLKMLLPKGNSAYVMNGRGASHYPKEHEVLLPRGSRFRVKSLVGNVMTVEVL